MWWCSHQGKIAIALSNVDATATVLLIFFFVGSGSRSHPPPKIRIIFWVGHISMEWDERNTKENDGEEAEEVEDEENKASATTHWPTPNKHNKENVSKNNLWRDIIYLSSCHRSRGSTLSF